MKNTITDLKWHRAQPDRVWIYLDGQACVSVSLVTASRFKVGDRVDADTVAQLRVGQQHRDVYRCALRLLGRRDHSGFEIRQKLSRRGFDAAAIDDALHRLIDKKYLNDQEFAANWINHRMNTAPRSLRLLAQELRQKGIGETQIDAALAHVDELELAKACIQRKRRRWRRFEGSARRLKMLAHLSNKGFSYNVSRSAIETYGDQAD